MELMDDAVDSKEVIADLIKAYNKRNSQLYCIMLLGG